jgi:hypothetical protein
MSNTETVIYMAFELLSDATRNSWCDIGLRVAHDPAVQCGD